MSDKLNDRLIAHRGYPLRYPENTLPGLRAAIAAGARYLEFDIQLTRDHVPVLLHDASLLRTAGIDRLIMELTVAELESCSAGEPDRFGERFGSTPIPSLDLVTQTLAAHPEVNAFVEIKRESLAYFGVTAVVGAVMSCLRNWPRQYIVISFDGDCLLHARQLGSNRVGWAIEEVDLHTRVTLENLQPEFLFTSVEAFPELRSLLRGSWQWAVYQTTDPGTACDLIENGAHLIETDAIVDMLDISRNTE